MSTAKVTHAQRHALRQIANGEIRSITGLEARVRRGLEMRGLLVWNQAHGSGWFGQIDRNATLARAKSAGVAL